jgi:hypothetical protein
VPPHGWTGEWWPVSDKLTATGRGESGGECVAQMELSTGSQVVLCGAVLDVSEGQLVLVLHCTEAEGAGGAHSGTRPTPCLQRGPPDMQLELEYHTNRQSGSLRQFSTLGWRTNCVSIFRKSVTPCAERP